MPIRRSWTWGLTRYDIGGSGPPQAWSLSPILIVNKTRYRSPQILFRPPLAQGPRGGRGRCQTSFRFIIARTRPAVAHWPPQPLPISARGSAVTGTCSSRRGAFIPGAQGLAAERRSRGFTPLAVHPRARKGLSARKNLSDRPRGRLNGSGPYGKPRKRFEKNGSGGADQARGLLFPLWAGFLGGESWGP